MSAAGMATAGSGDLAAIAAAVSRRTGLNDLDSRRPQLARAVEARCRELALTGARDYLALLLSPQGAGEWSRLYHAVTIGETSFWRHPAQWQALRDIVLPELRARRAGAPLRIWSAGCSTGAEAYSLALLLRQVAPLAGETFQILGTDLSAERLEQARGGQYSDWELRNLPEDLRAACFDREASGWRLRAEYRRDVTFRQHNLLEPADQAGLGGGFDLVMCRNVLIYFGSEQMRQVLRQLHDALSEGGWFVTGHSESFQDTASVFQRAAVPGAALFRRQAGPVAMPAAAPLRRTVPVRPRKPAPGSAAPVAPRVAPSPEEGAAALRALVDRGLWRDAAELGALMLAEKPLDPELHLLMAHACSHLRDLDGAEAALRRALYLDPGFALAHYQLGLVEAARSRHDSAALCFRNALSSLGALTEDAAVPAGDGVAAGDLRHAARLQLAQAAGRAG